MQTKPIEQTGEQYAWTYEMSLFKNPSIFLLVAKVLFGVILGLGIVIMLPMNLITNGWAEGFRGWLIEIGIISGLFAVLLVLGYLIYAAIMGGKYIVDFAMDEDRLVHAQITEQAKKASKVGTATALLGILAGRPSTVGIGLTSQRSVSTTEFARVKKVVANRRRSVIKLYGGGANEAYADGADFDFVCAHIRAHIPADAAWIDQ